LGIDLAFVGLTISMLTFEIIIIRTKNNAKLLLVPCILEFGIDFRYKASRK